MPKAASVKVVQIWPGQTVTCLHTNSPGHIWTTLYNQEERVILHNYGRDGHSVIRNVHGFDLQRLEREDG
jgi:hypothetical protein